MVQSYIKAAALGVVRPITSIALQNHVRLWLARPHSAETR